MKIYIDKEYKCHTTNLNGVYREFDVREFDGKCQTFIEGHRYCPKSEYYTREDGEVFSGASISPWKPYSELDSAQREYERQLLEEYQSENSEYKLMHSELNASYNEGINSI